MSDLKEFPHRWTVMVDRNGFTVANAEGTASTHFLWHPVSYGPVADWEDAKRCQEALFDAFEAAGCIKVGKHYGGLAYASATAADLELAIEHTYTLIADQTRRRPTRSTTPPPRASTPPPPRPKPKRTRATGPKADKLRTLIERGATEGERAAARAALERLEKVVA